MSLERKDNASLASRKPCSDVFGEAFSRRPQEDSAVQRFAPLLGCEVREAPGERRGVHRSLIVDQKLPMNRMLDRNGLGNAAVPQCAGVLRLRSHISRAARSY